MRIAITGATGYIGRRLVRAARLAGHEILALSRRPMAEPGVTWQAFDLADNLPLSLPEDIAVVFHLAVKTQHDFGESSVEQDAAQRLIEAAAVVGAGVVFVSSQAACADAPTAYGRIKWQIEGKTLAAGGWVVRPGQVYGGLSWDCSACCARWSGACRCCRRSSRLHTCSRCMWMILSMCCWPVLRRRHRRCCASLLLRASASRNFCKP
ncbi:SDR family oxidoreductase [Pseudomonas protegens]|nr:SDR family oxidoreductase [Pseudomonas protegens]